MTCRVASWYCGHIKAVKLDARLLCEKIRNFYKTSAWTHVQFMWNKYFIAYKTPSCWRCWTTFVNNSLHALSRNLRTLQMIIHICDTAKLHKLPLFYKTQFSNCYFVRSFFSIHMPKLEMSFTLTTLTSVCKETYIRPVLLEL